MILFKASSRLALLWIVIFLSFYILPSCTNDQKHEAKKELGSTEVTASEKEKEEPFTLYFEEDQLINKILLDFTQDDEVDTIFLLNPPIGDPGIFARILFRSKNDTISFSNESQWDSLAWKPLDNLVSSNLFYITESDHKQYLVLSGTQYGCCPEQTTIFSLNSKLPKKVFDEEFAPEHISDLNGDGVKELIGKTTFAQAYGVLSNSIDGFQETYSPFKVYEIKGNKVEIDYQQSLLYNQEHYVFAGYEYSEETPVIIFSDERKPELLDPNDAFECASSSLSELSSQIQNPSHEAILNFLLSFDQRCSNNIEFSEWSSELIIKLLTQHPEKLITVWQKHEPIIFSDIIRNEIESPLIDLDYALIETNMERIPESEFKNQIMVLIKKSKDADH